VRQVTRRGRRRAALPVEVLPGRAGRLRRHA
jgi:hypothetical protein